MRVLICGGREWRNREIILEVLREVVEIFGQDVTVVDGTCRGADELGHVAATLLGLRTERYPANWERYGKRAGHLRNQQMLDTGLDLVLAFHTNLAASQGTADMVARAKKAGVPVRIYNR